MVTVTLRFCPREQFSGISAAHRFGEDSTCYFSSTISAKIMKGVQTPGNLVKEAKMLSYAQISEQLRQNCSIPKLKYLPSMVILGLPLKVPAQR